jgi:hypothetical protein
VTVHLGSRASQGPALGDPLRAHWLHAIATEERAVTVAGELESLRPADAALRLRRLAGEREWVTAFHWPPAYEPAAG